MFEELKGKVPNAKFLDMHEAQREISMVTDACNIGGDGSFSQWQALEKE